MFCLQNAEVFRDPLKARQAPPGSVNPRSDSKLEATGVLTMLHTFDMLEKRTINQLLMDAGFSCYHFRKDVYDVLKRPKRSQTELTIMSCQFSPKKDYLAVSLSTGEIEVRPYLLLMYCHVQIRIVTVGVAI